MLDQESGEQCQDEAERGGDRDVALWAWRHTVGFDVRGIPNGRGERWLHRFPGTRREASPEAIVDEARECVGDRGADLLRALWISIVNGDLEHGCLRIDRNRQLREQRLRGHP